MFYRRPTWAQLTRDGIPSLYVLRPLGGFTPPALGDESTVQDPTDKFQLMRARQMYEQRRIGTWPDRELVLAKLKRLQPAASGTAAAPKPGKEKKHGSRSPQNRD